MRLSFDTLRRYIVNCINIPDTGESFQPLAIYIVNDVTRYKFASSGSILQHFLFFSQRKLPLSTEKYQLLHYYTIRHYYQPFCK